MLIMKNLCQLMAFLLISLTFSSCATMKRNGEPNPPAYRPKNPNNVVVKVSLDNRAVYVMEGDRLLLVAATCVGKPESPTPLGTYTVFSKLPHKRSNSYGFSVKGGDIRPCKRGDLPSGARYVGYPMPYWVEFKAGYGFHEGYVHPVPRSHGCLRLHKNVAPKFFALVQNGTPIRIAHSQPEDKTFGRNIPRPQDYQDPDPPNSFLISDKVFAAPSGNLFAD
jgi:hypothetical protein